MRYWRWWLLSVLFSLPFFFLMGFGAVQLWHTGLFVWVWWPMAACIMLALFLAWRWQRGRRLLQADFAPSLHWTERDRQAWQLVERRVQGVTEISLDQLGAFSFYARTAEDMALEMARFYKPGAADPMGSLTLIEILGVIELAAHDLAALMEQYVPGSHFLTIDSWRTAQKAVGWYQNISKAGWVLAGLFNPIGTAARYLATQMGVNKPWQKFQANLQLWFYHAFLQRLGAYLIELYGGRLRRGATRYRQLFGTPSGPRLSAASEPITFVIAGQTKAGKSSLINALLGERRAQTDVVEATAEITRYEMHPDKLDARLILIDTVGYANEGPRPDQLRATEKAAQLADVMLLVLHARNPARQADLDLLHKLQEFFARRPDLKKPPVLGVLTHIDLLSPSLEWSPPYDWTKPQRPKERHMAEAVAAVQEQLGDHLLGVVPVCTAPGKEFGVQEGLVPALTALLDEARAVALVRCLRGEADSGKMTKVVQQLLTVGSELIKAWLQPTAK